MQAVQRFFVIYRVFSVDVFVQAFEAGVGEFPRFQFQGRIFLGALERMGNAPIFFLWLRIA